MSSAKKRKNLPSVPRDDAEPSPPQLPPRPEYLQISPRHVIWRNSIQPDPAQPFRQVTWDVRFLENRITIHSDLAHEGEMRELDFREVRSKLDEIIYSKEMAVDMVRCHIERIRQSVFWQRIPEPLGVHLDTPYFDGNNGSWGFALSLPEDIAKLGQWISHPVLRRASDEMYLMRHEERQWLIYGRRNAEWADFLSLDADMCGCFRGAVCRMRLLHYWQIPECRQLFLSSGNFTVLFCADGILPALEDLSDPDWRTNATKLARLPRSELMALAGLPATEQVVRLFLRIKTREIVPSWHLIRQAFANPLALKRLSQTTCGIDEMMLNLCQHEPFPFHWPLFRQLCRDRSSCDLALSYIHRTVNTIPDDSIGQKIRRSFRRARSADAIKKVTRLTHWYRANWRELFKPGTQDALGKLSPPLPETESIRLLNRPLDLVTIGTTHDLCLGKYLLSIIEGKYALYQILYQQEFAVVGIQREGNEPWKIDQIKGAKNAEPTGGIKRLVEEWVGNN